MSFNGSGSFLINTAGQPVVSGTVISSTAFNALTADLATGLSTCITKDGQTTVTANIPMANYKFTGLGAGSGAADSANLSQVQSTVVKLLASVSGTDTITAVGSPTVAAYAAGQMFYFVAAGDNTGAVTINIDSLGAKAVTRDGSVALAAGDIKSGEVVVIVYDGTRFQVVSQLNSSGDARFANVSIASALNVGGVATFTGGTANGVTYLNGSKVLTSGTALVFDGSNLGLGVSPSSWLNTRAFDIGTFGAVSCDTATSGVLSLAYNAYAEGASTWKYKGAGAAGLYQQTEAHKWFTAASGTAGNAITFTQAMTLTAAGDLGVATTSPVSRLHVAGNIYAQNSGADTKIDVIAPSDSYAQYVRWAVTGVRNNGILGFPAGSDALVFRNGGDTFSNGTERFRVTSGGDLCINTTSSVSSAKVTIQNNTSSSVDASYLTLYGTNENVGHINYSNTFGVMARLTGTKLGGGSGADDGYFEVKTAVDAALTGGVYISNGATSWTAVSDEREKDIIEPINDAVNKVSSLRAVIGTYKSDHSSQRRSFLIAQDVQTVLPEAVEASNPDKLGLRYTEVIPLLVAAIKEQQAMINDLKAEVAALKGA